MMHCRVSAAICGVVASFVPIEGSAVAHPGALDPTFGHGTGEAAAQLGSFFDGASAVAPTSDGGVIIAGFVPTSEHGSDPAGPWRRCPRRVREPRAGRGATLSVTIRLIDKFSNRVDKSASAKIRH